MVAPHNENYVALLLYSAGEVSIRTQTQAILMYNFGNIYFN